MDILTKITFTVLLLILITNIIGLTYVWFEGEYIYWNKKASFWFKLRNKILLLLPIIGIIAIWS